MSMIDARNALRGNRVENYRMNC